MPKEVISRRKIGWGGPVFQLLPNGKLRFGDKGIKLDIRTSEMQDLLFTEKRAYESFRVVVYWSGKKLHSENSVKIFDEVFTDMANDAQRTIPIPDPLTIPGLGLPSGVGVLLIDRVYLCDLNNDRGSEYAPSLEASIEDGYQVVRIRQQYVNGAIM